MTKLLLLFWRRIVDQYRTVLALEHEQAACNPRSLIERKSEYRNTLVKKGATLGANCTIVCGITVGEYAFVGAGAVVNKDVKPYALMVGVPTRRNSL